MLRGNGSAGEVAVGRVILKCARISLARLTGGIDFTGKDICNGDAACLTAETGIEKSLNILSHGIRITEPPAITTTVLGFASATAATSSLCSAGISIPSLS